MQNDLKYSIFASKSLNIPDNISFSLIPSHMQYSLVFAERRNVPPGYVEIRDSDITNPQERAWLTRCKVAVNMQYVRQNEAEIAEELNCFIDRLEQELKTEKDNGKSQATTRAKVD